MGHEFALIDWIRQRATVASAVPIGIGDDCAVLDAGHGTRLLVAKDVLLEGTHFDLSSASPELVGRKALAVNLSDIAAMAGSPTAAFVGLALPRSRGVDFARKLMAGVQQLADEFGVAIAGGDTNIWDGPLVVSVTVVGEPSASGPILRSGALAGDWIFVTGPLGGSLGSGRHLSFKPRVQLARELQHAVSLHAMIDLSDGLSSDLVHITHESAVGAIVYADAIPVHPDVASELSQEKRQAHALHDGEDFELLFTVSPTDGQSLLREYPSYGCTQVGEIITGDNVVLRDSQGVLRPLECGGWEHMFH